MAQVQEFVEQALQLSTVDGCVVVAAEHTETNLRWANNSLTTNGQMSSRSVTVISVAGESAGVVTRSVSTADELAALVKASEAAARDASPADDFAPLVEPYDTDDDWDTDPATTSVDVFARFAPELGTAFKQAGKNGRLLFGFAEHEMTSVFVGSSTGLRRRYDQPNGRLELNGKSDDYTRSAWAGIYTRDFSDVALDAAWSALYSVVSGWAKRAAGPELATRLCREGSDRSGGQRGALQTERAWSGAGAIGLRRGGGQVRT